MVTAVTINQIAFEAIDIAYRLRLGEQIDPEHPLGWLKVFDSEELTELITEIQSTYRLVGLDPEAYNQLDALLHEWHESAIAISSQELAAAFNDELDEVLLTQPIVESATESTPI